jgi:Ca2+/Na+ antiporter
LCGYCDIPAMPILFLIAGLILLVLFLTFFQKGVSPDAQKTFWRFVLFFVVPAALFYLIILGRSLPALLVLFIVLPMIVKEIKSLRKQGKDDESITQDDMQDNVKQENLNLTHDEALKILGLEDGSSVADIKAAHSKLIKKNHPDQEGNAWLASKINAARDVLLEKNNKDV